MKNNESKAYGIVWTVFALVLFTVFLTLKLCGVISWHWVWVCAPLWLPLAANAVLLLILFIVYLVCTSIGGKNGK